MGIPTPEPGLVLNYAYLWHDEHRAGREEGRKDRPSVIVLSTTRESDDATIVTILPITHAAPADPKAAIEIPLPVKKHLGLDDARSWIVIAEGNEFVWPYDLRKAPKTDRYEFGFLPPRSLRFIRPGKQKHACSIRSAMRGISPDDVHPIADELNISCKRRVSYLAGASGF